MQLSAPRQGLFALVLFISFILQAFFTIYSIRAHQADVRQAQATLLLNQLSQEFAPTVLAKDTVGLSLLAKRYAHQQDINRLTVYAKNGQVLSQVGQAQTRSGEVFTGNITLENEPVGEIKLNLSIPSRGDVIAGQWPLFLASVLLHLGLWLLYRLFASQYVVVDAVARSNMASQRHIGDQVGDASDTNKPHDVPSSPASAAQRDSSQLGTNQANTAHRTATATGIGSYDLDAFIQEHADEAVTASTGTESGTGMTSFLRALSDQDDPVILQIQFDDPKSLLMKLSPTVAKPYYALCNKLLDTAIDELSFSGQIVKGIHFEKTAFAEDGVHIVATHTADIDSGQDLHKADVAYAATLLAKLYMLLHEVTYTRHREINRFALETKACISRKLNQPAMAQLLEFDASANAMLVLLEADDLLNLQGNIDLYPYPNPTTVLQRKVSLITDISPVLIRPLHVLRDKVLG